MPKALLKIVLLVATIFLSAAQAQQLPIALKAESYGVPEGLSQSTVTSVVEDDDGYIWIGTLNGLNRFDGREFKHFFANDRSGLSSSFIQSLLFDKKALLVGTDSGLNIYNSELETFERVEQINEAIWSINDNGDVYTIGTKDKIIELRKDNLEIIKIHQNDNFNFIKKAIKTNKEYTIRNYDGKIIRYGEDSTLTTLSLNSVDLIKSNHGIYTLSSDGIYKKISNDMPNYYDEDDIPLTVINGQVIQTNLESLETTSKGYVLDNKEIINQTQVYRTNNYTIIPSLNMGFILIRDSSNIVRSLINPTGNIWSINILDSNEIVTADDSNEIEIYNSNFILKEK
ncbi:sensory box/GGDEF family protein [Shewanella sp. HN-41]|nr:sensory box/GGDEF family protein [Shewanella sp. HN-41]